MAAIGLRV
jgi:hypothetical protein